MPTINQLIRHGREEKRRTDRTRASDQCPQKQGVRPRVSTRTPKKPNSRKNGGTNVLRPVTKNLKIHFLIRNSFSLVATFFGVRLLSEGKGYLLAGENLFFMGAFLFFLIFWFRAYSSRLYKMFGKGGILAIYCLIFFIILIYMTFFRFFIFETAFPFFSGYVFSVFLACCNVLPQGLPSSEVEGGEGNSRSSAWNSFDLDVLAEPFPETSTSAGGGGTTSSISVNKPEGERPLPSTNAVADSAGPSRVRPFPFQDDEIIGGDCLNNVSRRLLEAEAERRGEIGLNYELIRYQAEDLFEVKVEIIRRMAPLDPEGDWDRRGAKALENPRTKTGEEPLERLHALLEDLESGGVQSKAFWLLKDKVFRRQDCDSHSET